MVTISGTVENILYYNTENNFSIFSLVMDNDESTCVTGYFFELNENDYLKIYGDYTIHPSYGRQFKTNYYEPCFPENLNMLSKYLAKGFIKGIGLEKARKIVEYFRGDTLDILENEPDKLREINGIGESIVKSVKENFPKNIKQKRMYLEIGKYGISPTYAMKIYNYYKENSLHIIQSNPYELIQTISGISFLTADKIALKHGLSRTNKFRIQSGILFIMNNILSSGHVRIKREHLIQSAQKLLELDVLIESTIEEMLQADILVQLNRSNSKFIYTSKVRRKEIECADKLKILNRNISAKKVEHILKDSQTNLNETQMNAVKTAANSGLMILTGGPGVGKTTTTIMILHYFKTTQKTVLLASPTGRAAKRLFEATGYPASTIHRMLGKSEDGHGFEYDQENPLDTDVVIIDEVSMLDMFLLHSLLMAIPKRAQLILVGDNNQLPSVGAGNVLGDLIASKLCPVVELTKIYRQAADSEIISNAHHVLNGEPLSFSNKDFFFKSCDDVQEMKRLIAHYIKDALPKFTGENDIQVLTPLRVRDAGCESLNPYLQEKLNANGKQWKNFRVGDKVIQSKNNYNLQRINKNGHTELGVFNGDIGRVVEVNKEKKTMTVIFDDGYSSVYSESELAQLELAYSITVHKSQGTEYPVVIIPIWDYVPMITTMNLLYTGITRAKKMLLLIGSKECLKKIIHNRRLNFRETGLAEELKRN